MILRHLEYLVALARERHFGRAAATCGVTQPTLSAAIRELEAELDVLIVERGRRFSNLTAEGERVVEWARRILSDRDALRQEVGSARQGLTGHLVLGVIPTALAVVGLLISPFQRDHPRVRIKIMSLSSIEIQRGLDIFDLDAGVTYLDNEPLLRVGTLPLYRERYFLVTGDRGVFRRKDSVTWAEAADLPLCLLTPDMQNRRIVDAIFQEAQRVPVPLVETNSLLALYAQVRSRGMASIVTQASLYLLGMPRWLRAFPLVAPAARRTIGLVYPDREPQQPVARAFVESVRQLDIDGEMQRNIPRALRRGRAR
jgi:DNA-binding transcriptional LysR family regulator